MKFLKRITGMLLGFLMFVLILECTAPDKKSNPANYKEISNVAEGNARQHTVLTDTSKIVRSEYKVTFIELGSVRCYPCKEMQKVMKSIAEKYGDQVNVVFHDIWTPKGRPYGEKYGISAIPTQVFLDENDKEFFRHEGYFPEDELVKVLKTKGVR